MEPGYPLAENILQYFDQIQLAANLVRSRLGKADVAVVLGSGLSSFVSNLNYTKKLSYNEIPHMPQTTVPGHSGELIFGELPTKSGISLKILCFSGRVHWYEGFTFEQVNFLVRLAAACGCSYYILTNSAGGAIPDMKPGSAMIITDHIRFTRVDPLQNVVADPRLCHVERDRAGIYSERLIRLAKQAAENLGQTVYEGIYCWCGGPTYETPAEVQAAMRMGADAFGMSTVPEALAANAIGLEVFGISLCTNMACGLQLNEKLLHADVVRIAKESGPQFEKLLIEFFYNFDPFITSDRIIPELLPEQKSHLEKMQLFSIKGMWSGSSAMESDALLLRNIFKKDTLQYGVFLDAASSSVSLTITSPDVQSVKFADLPAFMSASPNAGPKGRILCFYGSTVSSKPIIVIEHNSKFGPLYDIDSHHLVGVLLRLGIRRVVQVVTASSLVDSEGWFNISDTVDLTNDKLYPGFKATVERLDVDVFKHLPETSLCVFPGPGNPTAAETRFTKVVGADVYTCTTLSPAYAALQSGLPSSVVAHAGSIVMNEALSVVCTTLSSLRDQSESQGRSAHAREIAPLPYSRVFQEQIAHVRIAATEIKGAFYPSIDQVDVAVVVDASLNSIISETKWRSSLSVENIQHWKQDLCLEWKLSIGESSNGNTFLCLHSSNRSQDCNTSLYDATFAIRVFKELNIETVVFVGTGISADSRIPVGSVIGVSDHVNCSGENPLFGPNEEEFGPRFPDVAGMYSPAPSVNCQTVVGYTSSVSGFNSKLAERLGFQVFCHNLIPEAIVARHSAMTIFALLWISGSCVSYEKAEISDSVCKELCSSLDQILS